MGIVKLALSGLAGVQQSTVTLGHAEVVYDPRQISATDIVTALQQKTPFQSELRSDEAWSPVQRERR